MAVCLSFTTCHCTVWSRSAVAGVPATAKHYSVVAPLIGDTGYAVGVSVYLTQDQVKTIFREQERSRIRDMAATSAGALNTTLQNLETQKKTWATICKEHNLSQAVMESFEATISLTQSTIQNSINSVIQIAGTEDNPYGYSKFESEINCLECRQPMAPRIQPFADANVVHRCEYCSHLQYVKRHFNGALSVSPYKSALHDAGRRSSESAGRKSKSTHLLRVDEGLVHCPKCNGEIHISTTSYGVLRRGCFKCKTSFEVNVDKGTVAPIKARCDAIESLDITSDPSGIPMVICRQCDNRIPMRYAVDWQGTFNLSCRRCGSILIDEKQLISREEYPVLSGKLPIGQL